MDALIFLFGKMNMKQFLYLTLTLLFVTVLSTCAQATPEHVEEMINPGDEIDGMLFTTTDEIDWDVSLLGFNS
jgi:hypothetical protein